MEFNSKIKKTVLSVLTIFFLSTRNIYSFDTKSKQAILMDFETEQILYKKNENEKAFPSSMTKIMTAYLIFEKLNNGDLRITDTFQISNEAWKQEGSRMFLNISSKVKIDELLKGLIVQSGNDSAYALAEGSSESVEDFVKQMNEKAKELNLMNTNFTNPIGFSENNHYMSVKDVAVLSRNLINNFPQYYLEYFSISEYKYNNILQQNRNTLIGKYDGVDGIKTGHTDAAGYSLAASASQNERRLISVVNGLNSEYDRINETKRLLNHGFMNFKKFQLYNKNQTIKEIPILYGKEKIVEAVVDNDIYVLSKKENEISVEINIEKELKAPVSKGKKVGTLTVKTNFDEKIYDLFSNKNIEQANIFKRLFLFIIYFFKNLL